MSNSGEPSSLRSFERLNRCINCYFSIPRNLHRHYLEHMPTPILNMLQSWISPTQLTPENVICVECLGLLRDRVNSMGESKALPLPAFGHRSVCFSCGCTILRAKKTYHVGQDCLERNILLQFVPLHLVCRMERVCAACWRSATREVQRQQQRDFNRPSLGDNVLSGNNNIVPHPLPFPSPRPQPVQPNIPKIN